MIYSLNKWHLRLAVETRKVFVFCLKAHLFNDNYCKTHQISLIFGGYVGKVYRLAI